MAARDIIQAKLDKMSWWWQKHHMRLFLSETRNRHYCGRCGGIMHYGVRFHPTYYPSTGEPYGVDFTVECENYRNAARDYYGHDTFMKFMPKSPFLIDYLRSNLYILGAQTILDVYEEES